MSKLIEKAKNALKRPQDFAYYGDLHEEDGWGRTGLAVHRDSDCLQRSNWEVITEDLLKRFPNDFAIDHSGHWAVGWIEKLRVRVVEEHTPIHSFNEADITDAFLAAIGWAQKLENYPVADESHYSRLEHDELIEWLADEAPIQWRQQRNEEDGDPPEDLADKVAYILFDEYSVSGLEDVSHEYMVYAINHIAEKKYAKD